MYYVAIVVGLLMVILIAVSSKKKVPIERKGIWKTLDKMSVLIIGVYRQITERIYGIGRHKKSAGNTGMDVCVFLEQLNPGAEIKRIKEDYVIKKVSMCMLIIIIGTLLGVAVKYSSKQKAIKINTSEGIRREDFSGSKREIYLQANIDGYEREINFQLHPRRLTAEELQDIVPEFREVLGKVLQAGNSSLNAVNSKLNPVPRVKGYPFSIRWSSSDYGLVSPTGGQVSEVEAECQVFMTAHIKYEGVTWDEEYVLTLVPNIYTDEELINIGLEKELIKTEEELRESEMMILPTEYDGKHIEWISSVNDSSLYIWIALVIVAVVVFFMSDKDLEKKVEDKKKTMTKEYADIVRKIALYVGAGMTVRMSFQKIATDAVASSKDNPIYREMIFTCRELKSGILEEEAYERFGRRTGVQKYIQLSTLLQQNIKRGSANLLGRLREEADNAAIERLQACRKRGEEAATKLLVPMVLMLLIVMVIIMLPAFSSMNL